MDSWRCGGHSPTAEGQERLLALMDAGQVSASIRIKSLLDWRRSCVPKDIVRGEWRQSRVCRRRVQPQVHEIGPDDMQIPQYWSVCVPLCVGCVVRGLLVIQVGTVARSIEDSGQRRGATRARSDCTVRHPGRGKGTCVLSLAPLRQSEEVIS
jgi:hypothetical protein